MRTDCLTAEDLDALRDSVQASINRFADANRVAQDVGAADLVVEARPALAVLFEEFGRSGLVNKLTDLVVRDALGVDLTDSASFVYPAPQFGVVMPHTAIRHSDNTQVDGLLRSANTPPTEVILTTSAGDTFTASTRELTVVPVAGFDKAGGWLRVTGTTWNDCVTDVRSGSGARAVAAAQLSLASEILGVAMAILAIAINHVTARHQFGRAIGGFQTVRHRLADAHVAIEAARPVVALGWESYPPESADSLIYAMASKALAGRAFETAMKHANQVCGAMGLTWEHPLSGLVRRGSALNALLGRPVDLAAQLGRAIAEGRILPVPDALVDDHPIRHDLCDTPAPMPGPCDTARRMPSNDREGM